ncbi:hypothetical protein NE237_005010 [Protea cynaroides]|uniref:LIM zinc-binding domain-containing protein n=1 Tax=Protea cynaroides TaxID=273540 RepID=A0A9Q0KKG7_9MAGN|nr:hypothetical protein NE237_005010 [Protea cynaroides]
MPLVKRKFDEFQDGLLNALFGFNQSFVARVKIENECFVLREMRSSEPQGQSCLLSLLRLYSFDRPGQSRLFCFPISFALSKHFEQVEKDPDLKLRMAFLGTQEKCKACDKTVYVVDQLSADGVSYHKACFKCTHCKGTLKLSNYSSMEGVLYCKPHFEQLFKQSGSYSSKSFQSPVRAAAKLTPELVILPRTAESYL